MIPIATKVNLLEYLPISKGCNNNIDFYILEEQTLTLKNWLGDCFFKEYELKKEEPLFQTLLFGGSWNDDKNQCDGLIKVLCYLAYGEYLVFNNYTDTPFGTKIKDFEDGLPTPPEALETLRNRYRNKAIAYFESCKKFLCSNKEYFSYKGKCDCTDENDFQQTRRLRTRTLYTNNNINDNCNTCKND